jgi:hypothetical protein
VGSSADGFRIMDIIIYFVETQALDGSIDAAPERAVSLLSKQLFSRCG